MTLKKDILRKPGLYLVTDKDALKGKDILKVILRSLEAGIDIIQFRDKEASDQEFLETGKKIKNLARERDALFIVNDRVEEALELDSDGVHLGQDDLSVESARRLLGREKIIGLSTHSVEQIRAAAEKDIDYISVGPVFPTQTKPGYRAVGLELIRTATKEIRLPFIAIGGINETNIKDVIESGAKRIAVVRAILSSNVPLTATKTLLKKIYDADRVCKTE